MMNPHNITLETRLFLNIFQKQIYCKNLILNKLTLINNQINIAN